MFIYGGVFYIDLCTSCSMIVLLGKSKWPSTVCLSKHDSHSRLSCSGGLKKYLFFHEIHIYKKSETRVWL